MKRALFAMIAAIHVYKGADHAFADPSKRYLKEAAQDAWKRSSRFLTRT